MRYVVVDQARQLGNRASAGFTAKARESIGTDFKVLIRAILLQDDINELLWLLSYLDRAGLWALPKQPQPSNVKELLEPLTLRRLRSEISMTFLSLNEIRVDCPMTAYKLAYYRELLERHRGREGRPGA
jgi:hypothetical protein